MATDISATGGLLVITSPDAKRYHNLEDLNAFEFEDTQLIFNTNTKSYIIPLSDLRISGAGSAPASVAAAETALEALFPEAGGSASATYSVYTALVSQSGTDTPTVSLRHDDIEGVWSRNAAGSYHYTKAGAFPANKIWIPYGLDGNSIGTFVENSNNILVSLTRMSDDVLELVTNEDGVGNSDDWLSNTPIEFRVYP